MAECLARLLERVRRLREEGADALLREWRQFGQSNLEGRAVHWRDQRGDCRGTARGIDADGALLVDREGRLDRVIAGEVAWEPSI